MELALMIIRALPALILVFLIWPLTLGAGIGLKKNLDRYLVGFAAVQALFFIVYIPAIALAWSSRTLTYSATVLISVIGIGGAIIGCLRSTSPRDFFALKIPSFAFLKNVFFCGTLLILIYELWTYVHREPWIYGDDVSYITLITRFVDTDAIYTKTSTEQVEMMLLENVSFKAVFTSYYPFLGMISILSNLHPLVLCKTVVPLVYLPVHFLIVWRFGNYLFRNEKDERNRVKRQSIFFFFYAILIEFGQISYYTMSRRVTIWIYNSKSDFLTLLLPILFFYTFIFLVEKEENEFTWSRSNLFKRLLIITILAIACNSSTLMGVLMSPIIMGIWYIVAALKHKKASILVLSLWTFIPHIVTGILLICFTGFTLG